jgi:hypothetical protein
MTEWRPVRADGASHTERLSRDARRPGWGRASRNEQACAPYVT